MLTTAAKDDFTTARTLLDDKDLAILQTASKKCPDNSKRNFRPDTFKRNSHTRTDKAYGRFWCYKAIRHIARP